MGAGGEMDGGPISQAEQQKGHHWSFPSSGCYANWLRAELPMGEEGAQSGFLLARMVTDGHCSWERKLIITKQSTWPLWLK